MKHFTNYSLKDHNTLKIDVSCDDFYLIENQDDIKELASHTSLQSEPHLVIGEGANILFSQDVKGNVIQLDTHDIRLMEESDSDVTLEVDGGTRWDDLVKYSVEQNLGGIENMVLIPGLVSGAAVGNIAAYGQNFSDVCEGVTVFDWKTGEIIKLTKDECGFTYRDSNFKNKYKDIYLVLSVTIRLAKNPEINSEYWSRKHGSVGEILTESGPGPYTLKDVSQAIVKIRKSKFPDMDVTGTAGSFFKNPVVTKEKFKEINDLIPGIQYYPVNDLRYIDNNGKMPDDLVKIAAGEVLDQGMGYKGLWIGNVGLFEKHALVLVTNGKATGAEVEAFAQKIQDDFFDYCGVKLEREVITI